MKLRNKKTGVIGHIEDNLRTFDPFTNESLVTVRYKDKYGINCYKDYRTIKEFNEEWEDYTTVEPLIKDEKIRKAVRAWAEAVGVCECKYDGFWKAFRYEEFSIGFSYKFTPNFGELSDGMTYTIQELCGEEEE